MAPAHDTFIPGPELLDSAANCVILAHHLRIRFMNLIRGLMCPELIKSLSEAYYPEKIEAASLQSIAICRRFKLAGEDFRSLDSVTHDSVKLVERFEAEPNNLAVEWEATGMFPVPKVEVGKPFPGIEDGKECRPEGNDR
ncbi:uncharacterized protein B0H64DRAFT_436383 [Chaetomium fimeti]|uniref:Uncharacterized protein n=1 Tax=Chaetomium fimeti TaxID=1854472 RepID=A0AAE0H6Y7_9PEZI|nr:hypothetical protein B0H64DRAFT_436383 [Chaetomium fimeti]